MEKHSELVPLYAELVLPEPPKTPKTESQPAEYRCIIIDLAGEDSDLVEEIKR